MPLAPPPLALLGLGAVGRRLALAWHRAGLEVRCYSPSAASRSRARVEGLTTAETLDEALADAAVVVLAVPDDLIEPAAASVSAVLATQAPGHHPPCLHTSGCRGTRVLASVALTGSPIGSLHPLAAFAPDGPGPRFEGLWCAIGGDPRARAAAEELVAAFGGRTLQLSAGESAAASYHAAAALLSNGTVALCSLALELAGRACEDPAAARSAFLALLSATVTNLEQHAPERALTGPVARGDSATVRAHLDALAPDPRLSALYRLLSRHLVELAARDGRLDPRAAAELERLLGP